MTMSGQAYTPSAVDKHIGKRIQLRRMIMGLSLKDVAKFCGVTFQQIQKYENAENRISASRLFDIGRALETPASFFFMGLPGNLPDETKATRSRRVSEPSAPDNLLSKNESLEILSLYWHLPDDNQREIIKNLLKTMSVASNQPVPSNK